MIVVIGLPAYADSPDGEQCAGGLAVDVAAAARRWGSSVELVGKVGNDGAGDAVVVALGRLGIGHCCAIRSGRRRFWPLRPPPTKARSWSRTASRRGCSPKTPISGPLSKRPTLSWPCASCPRRAWW